MIGIYKIENIVNGKVYVGQSINIEQRWYNHKNELNGNRHCNLYLQNAWNKYGKDSFVFSVLEQCELNNIDEKEIYWIELYDSLNPDKGYNLTAGGQGTHGHIWSEEQRYNHFLASKSEPILQFDLNGNLIERWRSSAYASRELNIPVSGIRNCVKKDEKYYKCHDYIWISEELYNEKGFDINQYIKDHFSEREPIFQFDYYGNLVKVWESTLEIIKFFGLKSKEYKSIFGTLKLKRTTGSNYIWLYKNDINILTEDYLRKIRINTYTYKINQFDKLGNLIKTWTQEELKETNYRFDTIRKCCTDNYKGHTINGMAFSYIWKYE